LVISVLNNTDTWSVDITDDAGSIMVLTNEYLTTDNQNSLLIEIYPNLASNEIQINGITEPTKIDIYSITGPLLIDSQLTTNAQIDIKEPPKGTYTLVATSSNGTITKGLLNNKKK
jgi:hypothetical protein